MTTDDQLAGSFVLILGLVCLFLGFFMMERDSDEELLKQVVVGKD